MLFPIFSAPHFLRLTTVVTCLWVAAPVVPDRVHFDLIAHQSPFSTLVNLYTEALDRRAPNDILATIHSQSPLYTMTIQQIQQVFPFYDVQVVHEGFRDLGSDGRDHIATVTFSYMKRTGPIFQNNSTKAAVVFRQEQGTWKIWAILTIEVTPLP